MKVFLKDLCAAEGGFPLFWVPGLLSKGPHPAGTGVAWCGAWVLQAIVSHMWDADLGSMIADTTSLHC